MDVHVDQSRQQCHVAEVHDLRPRRRLHATLFHRTDRPALDEHEHPLDQPQMLSIKQAGSADREHRHLPCCMRDRTDAALSTICRRDALCTRIATKRDKDTGFPSVTARLVMVRCGYITLYSSGTHEVVWHIAYLRRSATCSPVTDLPP